MNDRPDRPPLLPAKTRPTPAPNLRDPIDLVDPLPASSPEPQTPALHPYTPAVREKIVPLNTRVSESVADIARQASTDTGLTLRQVIEAAIITRWGNGS